MSEATVEPCDETPKERIAEIQERLDSPGDELSYVSRGDVEWLIERVRELEESGKASSS